MPIADLTEGKGRRIFIAVVFIITLVLFIRLIWDMLLAVMVAAIFASLANPLYSWLLQRLRGRRAGAATLTLFAVILVVVIPLIVLISALTSEAVKLANSLQPQLDLIVEQTKNHEILPKWIPFWDRIEPFREPIVKKLGEVAAMIGSFLVGSLSAVAEGAMRFFFNLFVMLYCLFFFLMNGRDLLDKILRLIPLRLSEKKLFVESFFSVSKATIKGTLVIGIVQGGMAGMAFAVVGIQDALFWGTIMMVSSIIPAIGTALIWVPAVLYLLIIGNTASAIGLFLWCAIVVGMADNFLRPLLVGKNTQMPDLLVMLSTFGGLALFGAIGLIFGPVIAALFLSAARIYNSTFRDVLSVPEAGAELE